MLKIEELFCCQFLYQEDSFECFRLELGLAFQMMFDNGHQVL
jgi:hypothetical protein